MIQLKAAIFDMDGVIIDNHRYHVKSWAEFCQKHMIPFDETTFRTKYFGRTSQDIFRELVDRNLSNEQIEILSEEKELIYRNIYKDFITPVHGLVPFLQSLKDSGIMTAVATSAPTSNLDFVLDKLEIRRYFDIVVDASGVTKGKPDPEIYLKAAKLLGVSPNHCVVFEDSISGILSGQSAGMEVIALTTTHTKDELPSTSITVKDFTDISLERINNNVIRS